MYSVLSFFEWQSSVFLARLAILGSSDSKPFQRTSRQMAGRRCGPGFVWELRSASWRSAASAGLPGGSRSMSWRSKQEEEESKHVLAIARELDRRWALLANAKTAPRNAIVNTNVSTRRCNKFHARNKQIRSCRFYRSISDSYFNS